jgi:hypothetical protein
LSPLLRFVRYLQSLVFGAEDRPPLLHRIQEAHGHLLRGLQESGVSLARSVQERCVPVLRSAQERFALVLRSGQERCAPIWRRLQERCAPVLRDIEERCAPLVRSVQERADPLVSRVQERGGALVRNIYDGRRPPSRLTLGVAAATVAAVTGVVIGLSVTATPTARLDSQQAPFSGLASGVAAAAGAPGHTSRPGHASSQSGGQASAAHAAPTPSGPSPAASQHQATTPAKRPASARPTPSPAPSPSAKPTPPQPTPPPQPYLIYDSVTPSAIPADHPVVATYADGPHPTPASEVAGRDSVLWIDIDASDPQAGALDIEPGCADPSQAAGWVWNRLHDDPHATAVLYTMISQWSTVRADVASLPSWMQDHIRWWIADPTGQPHIVPGSQATQWYWGPNYDISTAEPGF